MEQNVDCYYKKEKDRKKECSCLWIIVAILSVILSFFVGILIESLVAIVATLGIGAIVALIIILIVLLIIALINVICCKKNDKKKCCY